MERSWYETIQRHVYRMSQMVVRIGLATIMDLRVEGHEHVPREGGVILCSNHQSYLDPMILGSSITRQLDYMARDTLFRNRLFGSLIALYNAIPIPRERTGTAGLKAMIERLNHGRMVVLFPEGTRTADGRLGKLKPGVCTIVRRCPVPVSLLPVGIAGAYESWPRNRTLPRICPLRVSIGSPIALDPATKPDSEQLLGELSASMERCLQRAVIARSGSWPPRD